jgi:hypothetical protein
MWPDEVPSAGLSPQCVRGMPRVSVGKQSRASGRSKTVARSAARSRFAASGRVAR